MMNRFFFSFSFGVALAGGACLAVACSGSNGGNSGTDSGEPPITCDAGCIDGQVTSGPPGQLDPSFGTKGTTRLPVPNDLVFSSRLLGMKRASDGSLYIAYPADSRTGVAHLHADGTIDDAYGGEDVGLADVPGSSLAFALDAAGGVILLQNAPTSGSTSTGYVLVRLTPAGIVDSAFGTNGTAGPFLDSPVFYPSFIVPRADGKILLVGYVDDSTTNAAFALHGSDGSRDGAFGVKRDSTFASPTGVETLADGSIAVLITLSGILTKDDAGTYHSSCEASLRHYDMNGNLDTAFGSGGSVAVPLPANGGTETNGAIALATPHDGVIYSFAVEADGDGGTYVGAFRVSSQGAPDMTLGAGGAMVTPVDTTSGYPSVAATVADGDGFALGGFRQTGVGSGHAWLADLSSGALSEAFDQGVASDAGFASSGIYEVEAIVREPGSSKLIVGGETGNGFVVARVYP